jgi:putative CGCGG family rSAM target protein
MFATGYSGRALERESMSEAATRYDGREPVTRRVHEQPWIADLETPAHAADRELVVAEAIDAIEQTATGTRIEILTHQNHGHPSEYLYSRLDRFEGVEISHAGRCDCDGYATAVVV